MSRHSDRITMHDVLNGLPVNVLRKEVIQPDSGFVVDPYIAERQTVRGHGAENPRLGQMYVGDIMSSQVQDIREPYQTLVGVISAGPGDNYGIVDTVIGEGDNRQSVRMVTRFGPDKGNGEILGFVIDDRGLRVTTRRGDFEISNSYKPDTVNVTNCSDGELYLGSAKRPRDRFDLGSALSGLLSSLLYRDTPRKPKHGLVYDRGWTVDPNTIERTYRDFVAAVEASERAEAERRMRQSVIGTH